MCGKATPPLPYRELSRPVESVGIFAGCRYRIRARPRGRNGCRACIGDKIYSHCSATQMPMLIRKLYQARPAIWVSMGYRQYSHKEPERTSTTECGHQKAPRDERIGEQKSGNAGDVYYTLCHPPPRDILNELSNTIPTRRRKSRVDAARHVTYYDNLYPYTVSL